MRWGLAKGFQSNESGVGTASIPHSMSESKTPMDQGILSMAAVYSNGFLCLLTGFVILLTGVWKDTTLGFGINVVLKAFSLYIPRFGSIILMSCSVFFILTTILGNAYNGSQCFSYITGKKNLKTYYIFISLAVFLGALLDVEFVWTVVDFFVIPVACPNVLALVFINFKKPLKPKKSFILAKKPST